MALTLPGYSVENIQGLADLTKDQATAVKVLFDKTGADTKAFLVDTMIPELNTLDAANVKKTGDQTITGVKTFSSSPIVPAPTTDMQTSTKKYVDDNNTSQSNALATHKLTATGDHDGRYYTEAEADAKYETITDLTTTRKLSATGDFTGTLNGMVITAAEPGLSAEILGAHISAVKAKTFATIDARFEESEQDLVLYKADYATVLINAKYPPSPLIGVALNGSTDDMAKLNIIIAYVSTTYTKGIVYLPYGTLLCETALVMASGVYIYCQGTIFKNKAGVNLGVGVIPFNNVSDCGLLGRAFVDGNKANVAIINGTNGCDIRGTTNNIYIEDLTCYDCVEDGLYVRTTGTNSNNRIKNIDVSNCGRNGVSIVQCNGLVIDILITHGHISNAPKAGIDFEPNFVTDDMKNITIRNLTSYDNGGGGVTFLGKNWTSWRNINIDNLNVFNNNGGSRFEMVANIHLGRGSIRNCVTGYGVELARDIYNITIDCDVHNNPSLGVSCVLSTQTVKSKRIKINGNVFNNSLSVANTYDGVAVESDSATYPIDDFVITGDLYDDQAVKTQRYGLRVGNNVGSVKFTGRGFGNLTATWTSSNFISKEGIKFTALKTVPITTIPANSMVEVSLALAGVTAYSRAYATPNTIEAGLLWCCYCWTDVIRIRLFNATASPITTAANDFYIDIVKV
jgi:hypothetical protein